MQKLPSRTSLLIKNKELELKGLDPYEPIKEENYGHLINSRRNNKRGKGGREQGSGRKWQRRASGSKYHTGNQSLHLKQQGQRTNGQSSARGRRTVRKRAEKRAADNTMVVSRMADVVKPKASAVPARDLDEEWGAGKFRMVPNVNPPDYISAEEESDDNAQGDEEYEQGNWELEFNGASNGWNAEPAEASDEEEDNDDAYEEENGIEQLGEEDSDGDLEMSDASDEGAADKIRNDDGSDSPISDDYSD